MWVSLPAEATKTTGHQDQERQHTGMPNMLGTRSAAAPTWDVPGGRPAGAQEPKTGHQLPTVWSEWPANGSADAADHGSLRIRPTGGWESNHPVGMESSWTEQPPKT